MDHLPEIVSRALAQSNASTEPPSRTLTAAAEERAAWVWRSMTQLYGPAFLSAYGESPFATAKEPGAPLWLAAIERLTNEQCSLGFHRLAGEAREWPCNLTQFIDACTRRHTNEGVRFLGVPLTKEQWRELEAPWTRAKNADSVLAACRQILGVRRPS